jgi:uncharacterized protein
MVKQITPLTRRRAEYYSDVRKDLALNLVSNDVSKRTDEEAVKESIRNLILTDRGERFFRPNLGCDVRRQLFENYSIETRIAVENTIKEVIRFYEPRCNLISVNVSATADLNLMSIDIVFSVINIENPINLSVTMERVR